MDKAIDIFTIIGSVLGILAFVRVDLNLKRQHNMNNWDVLTGILDIESLDDLAEKASHGVIPTVSYRKLNAFAEKIKIKHPATKFKGRNGKKIMLKLDRIIESLDRFKDEVQVPKWMPPNNSGREDVLFVMNKGNIDFERMNKKMNVTYDEFYLSSIQNASRQIDDIIERYREISDLVTKLPFESRFRVH